MYNVWLSYARVVLTSGTCLCAVGSTFVKGRAGLRKGANGLHFPEYNAPYRRDFRNPCEPRRHWRDCRAQGRGDIGARAGHNDRNCARSSHRTISRESSAPQFRCRQRRFRPSKQYSDSSQGSVLSAFGALSRLWHAREQSAAPWESAKHLNPEVPVRRVDQSVQCRGVDLGTGSHFHVTHVLACAFKQTGRIL